MLLTEPLATVEECQVTCSGRAYVIRRFPDRLVALYDGTGRLVAGWPLTAVWPDGPLASQSAETLCAAIKRLFQTY